ncbi:MAG: hypothetical protein WC205_05300 [Opitutaceae bacterium]|jgi:hypothetical protein
MSVDGQAVLSVAEERERVAAVWHEWVPTVLARQCCDGSVNDGGFAQDDTGWYCGRHAAYTLARLMAAHLWADELRLSYASLDTACGRALAFLLRRQAADGSLDLGSFYTSNEVGFPITGLALAWKRMNEAGVSPGRAFMDNLMLFCTRGGEAILAGSPLTANHRWAAVCAPLAALNLIRPDARYVAQIERLLAQGVDVNADGCWEHERSPNYNNVANQGMIALADALGRPQLLEAVVENGRFLLHSLQPNGEMDSTISHRQDRAQPDCPACSYGLARRLALITGDGRYTQLAQASWSSYPEPERELVPLLLQLDAMPEPLPQAVKLPDRYEVFFETTGQVRHRTPRTSVSLAADAGGHFYDTVRDRWGGAKRSDDWFHLHHGDVVIESLVLAGAGMQNMQPGVLKRIETGSYELTADQPGWLHTLHFAPGAPQVPVRWDWRTRIAVRITDSGVVFSIRSATPKSLAASLHWLVRPGVTLHQAGLAPRVLLAGEGIALAGGAPFRLMADDGSTVSVAGLPNGEHRLPLLHAPGIPSGMAHTCATLSLGLTFPVCLDLELTFPG